MSVPKEIFVPAVISKVGTYEPGEIRKVELTLPETYELEGQIYRIKDQMKPGTAFLARPFGLRTGKYRRRMYTRSNCSFDTPRILETIINVSDQAKADTSSWWQTGEIDVLLEKKGWVDIRVNCLIDSGELVVYENTSTIQDNNLLLESDNDWASMHIVALAFSTGITPFLSYIRHMKRSNFGKMVHRKGCKFVLIVSVRRASQLMEHEELLVLAKDFPEHFHYYPILTREWPASWPFPKGRIMQVEMTEGNEERVGLQTLLGLVPTINQFHVRMCGNAKAKKQLLAGFKQHGLKPLSFRAEVW